MSVLVTHSVPPRFHPVPDHFQLPAPAAGAYIQASGAANLLQKEKRRPQGRKEKEMKMQITNPEDLEKVTGGGLVTMPDPFDPFPGEKEQKQQSEAIKDAGF